MTLRKNFAKKGLCFLLAAILLLSFVPMLSALKVSAEDNRDTRVVDPSTMNDWKKFFLGDMPKTDNAGAIWTDKSVFTNADEFGGLVTMQDKDSNFLVALSAISAKKSITGYSHVPTDTIFVLDVSRTMGKNVRPDDNNNDAIDELVASANKAIDRLMSDSKHNRVGVVLYSGTYSPDAHADAQSAMVLLPLGRYEHSEGSFLVKDNHIFKVGETLLTAESIKINDNVTSSGVPMEPKEREVYGGSFVQGGVYTAMTEFLSVKDTEISSDEFQSGTKRLPAIVLMSDGLATSAVTAYMGNGTDIGTSDMGDGTTPEDELSTAIPFVTQLTCSYAKEKIEEHYGRDALFYTLGYKVKSTPVLDPSNKTTDTHWNTYNVTDIGEFMQLAVKSTWVKSGWWGEGHWDTEYKVIEKSAYELSADYVDKYFHTDSDLEGVITAITDEISNKSLYYPTRVESGNMDLDGYVEFIDDIGEFMEVKKVHGILLGDTLFAGDNVAKNFIPGGGGGNLGSIDKPTYLGDELIRSVKARLGISDTKTAQELVRAAFNAKQLYNNPATGEWSNFIGWYESASGEYIGHGTKYDTKPLEGAKYYNESYGYLGKVVDGNNSSDMMYISVRLRTELATNNTSVIFSIPASLIPVIVYNVSITGDSLKNPGEITLTIDDTMGIDTDDDGVYDKKLPMAPIRLLYEVGTDNRINELNVSELAGKDYKYTENGNYDFYVSRWNKEALNHQNPSLAENAISFYKPSTENERYYYTENATVYKMSGEEYVPYEGTESPADAEESFYREYAVFEVINNNETGNGRVHLHYEQMSEEALGAAKQSGTTWYVPKGTVHRMYGTFHAAKGGFADESKTQANSNKTETIMYSHYFGVESVPDEKNSYYADVILGNNGRISIKQAQGIRISTESDVTLQKCNDLFSFEIKTQGEEITTPFTLTTIDKTGLVTEESARFENGSFVVGLKAGGVAYLTGLPSGTQLNIAEVQDNNDHQVKSVNGEDVTDITLTVPENAVAFADFINELASPIGCGALVVQGTVKHPYEEDYVIPEEIKFVYDVAYTNTAGEDVVEQITLSAEEIYHITDIALGTVATVTEAKINPGFNCEYPTHSISVNVDKEDNYITFFNNTYTPESVSPEINVTGVKNLYGRADAQWLESDVFTLRLQKLCGNEWKDMTYVDESGNVQSVVATVSKNSRTFDFSSSLRAEVYTEPGVYSYRIIEDADENPKDGITYDKSVRWFDVFVTDRDMDGKLEIGKVVPYMGTTADLNNETGVWSVNASFTNTYLIMGSDEVNIIVNTRVEDKSQGMGSEDAFALSGYEYALYQNDRLVAVLPATNEEGRTHINLSYGTFDIGKHIHYVLKPMAVSETVSDMLYSDTEYHIVVDVMDDTKGGVYAQLTATSSESGTEAIIGNEVELEFVNIYSPAVPPVTEPEPSEGTEPSEPPSVPDAPEDPTNSTEKPQNNINPDVPETGAGTAIDNITWLLFIVLVLVGGVGIFVTGKRK